MSGGERDHLYGCRRHLTMHGSDRLTVRQGFALLKLAQGYSLDEFDPQERRNLRRAQAKLLRAWKSARLSPRHAGESTMTRVNVEAGGRADEP
jgi:hypothetical protein